MSQLCRDYQRGKCTRQNCRFLHTNNSQTTNVNQTTHTHNARSSVSTSTRQKPDARRKPKNTVCFEPMTEPVDMRLVFDLGSQSLSTSLTSRDVLVVPNIFTEFAPGELYSKLVKELDSCSVPKEQLLKLWHGNDKIEGTHLIANDRTRWKDECPTFTYVVDKIRQFFNMDIQATRFNWYKDTSQWKPFHHDSAYVNEEKAKIQNFTVAASFGCTRDAAFEHAKSKTVISLPQNDGVIYCFANDTNGIWRHGILQDMPVRNEGRISVICWGKVDGIAQSPPLSLALQLPHPTTTNQN